MICRTFQNITRLLTCIIMGVCHYYNMHLCTLCELDSTWIHDKQKFCLPSLSLSRSLSLSLLLVGGALQDRHRMGDMWLDDHKARWAKPAKPTRSASQNPWGWLSVSSTRSPGCLLIIHWSPDVMISLGDPLCIIMLKANIQCASRALVLYALVWPEDIGNDAWATSKRQQKVPVRFWWSLIPSLHQTLNMSTKHKQDFSPHEYLW